MATPFGNFIEQFWRFRRTNTEPATDYVAVTPSDTVNFTNTSGVTMPCRALWIGGAGIVQAVRMDDTVVAFTCAAGSVLPIRCKRVNSTVPSSTTATLIVALFE